MSVKNLSQLKKELQKGKRFIVVDHHKPELIGQLREVNKVQTNGIYTIIPNDQKSKYTTCNDGKGSWMEYNKSSYYKFGETIKWYSQPIGTENNKMIMEFKLA